VPDAVLLPDSSYVHTGDYIYKENGVKISRTAKIGTGVVIGSGTVIEGNAVIETSVLGRNCIVKANAIVKDSHLWANVLVEENAQIYNSILCDDVSVKKSSKIPRGCILSFGVTIGEGVQLSEYTRISLLQSFSKINDANTNNSDDRYDSALVGADGKGFLWTPEGKGDYDDDESSQSEDSGESALFFESIDSLKAASIGCLEEELWKMHLWVNLFLIHIVLFYRFIIIIIDIYLG